MDLQLSNLSLSACPSSLHSAPSLHSSPLLSFLPFLSFHFNPSEFHRGSTLSPDIKMLAGRNATRYLAVLVASTSQNVGDPTCHIRCSAIVPAPFPCLLQGQELHATCVPVHLELCLISVILDSVFLLSLTLGRTLLCASPLDSNQCDYPQSKVLLQMSECGRIRSFITVK